MENIPKHIVLFPDGNRRWAKNRGLDSLIGHKQGDKNLIDFVQWCIDKKIKILTAFGFSTENWKRSKQEVGYLMNLFEVTLREYLEKFKENGIRVTIIGQKERLPYKLQEIIKGAEFETKNNDKFYLNLAVSYGGRWDILNAVKKIVEEKIPAKDITDELFESHLSTAGLPDPDLIIRAGGQMRLSNFVLWQGAYAELYFSPKLWPDFTEDDLDAALEEFDKRARRFGK